MLYVVSYNISERGNATIAGVYTDPKVAEKVRLLTGFSATVSQVEINHINPGLRAFAKELGMKL